VNPNKYTVSIEHAGYTGKLTEAQFASTVALHKYIRDYVKEHYKVDIPMDRTHVIGHFEVDPVRKPNCPGPDFPWTRLIAALQPEPAPTPAPPKPAPVTGDTYKVVKGDTLSEIAVKFHTTVEAIKDLNGLKSDLIKVGQVLKIPGASQPVFHVVVKGDTVSELASHFGSTIAQIRAWNNLDSKYTIQLGEKLRVK
jgi:LysM repeat protein